MPIALLLIGLVLILAGVRNQVAALGKLLAGDFSGQGNFFYWLAALGAIGAVGYYAPFRNASRLFLFLVVVAMVLADQGFFAQLESAIANAKPSPSTPDPSGSTGITPGGGSFGGGGSSGGWEGDAKTALDAAKLAVMVLG